MSTPKDQFSRQSQATSSTFDERSSLLHPNTQKDSVTENDVSSWLAEIWLLIKASVPVILAYMLQNSLQTLSILIVGQLSPEALATAAFSYMFAMASAWLIALGGTTALDTLASSSYTSSADKRSLGILLQRGIFVLTCFYSVVAIIWCFSEHIFRALGQENFICVQSSRFLQLLIPGGLGYIWFECMKKFLQAQGIFQPGTYTLLIVSPVNALLNYVFVYPLGFGLYGAPVATGISYWLSFLLLVAYSAFIRGNECWSGFALRRALTNVWPFAKLAFMGVIHVGTEWWAFEIVALAAGRLGTISLAAQSVLMTMDQIINTIPFGLGVAASARIGNLLGAGDSQGAKRASHSASILSVFIGGLVMTMLIATRNDIGKLFNDDQNVISAVSHVMPYVALFQIADGLNGACGGALRGMGRQWVGALVNCISYYGGALPLGIYLAFNGWDLSGLWFGQLVALSLVGAIEWIIVGMSNWSAEVQKASKRLEEGGVGVDSSDAVAQV